MADTAAPAVVLFAYNRPTQTARVFSAIRAAAPRRLFVFADGPREAIAGDLARTTAARAATEDVDWDCEVSRDYAPVNLGIKRRVETGLRRVFDEQETAVVLEDDCLPHPSFFRFCAELLARYEHEARVMSIGGSRLTPVAPDEGTSYTFSRYPFLWGWATWRRAWHRYDSGMQAWPARRDSGWLIDMLGDAHAAAYWTYLFDSTQHAGDRGDWDTAWTFSTWAVGGLSIIPAVNLISNLGFHAEATHTRDEGHMFSALPTSPMLYPLVHPDQVAASKATDHMAASLVFSGNLKRLMTSLHRRIRERRE